MNDTDWQILIKPRRLAAVLGEPADTRIVDCRFDLADPEAGRRTWRERRIPGAVHADLERDLSGVVTSRTGRHPLPDPARFVAWLGQSGIARTTRVACYDAGPGMFAARLWWLLRHWLGHGPVAVLDGGFAAWLAEDLPVEQGVPATPPAASYPDVVPRDVAVDAAAIAEGGLRVIDARAAARFRGDEEPLDSVAGHVPGAENRPFTENIDAHGRWRSPAALRADWEALLGPAPRDRVVHMCGSGVTACHNLLAMERAGLAGSRLYPGSWSEWIRDPRHPVEQGAGRRDRREPPSSNLCQGTPGEV